MKQSEIRDLATEYATLFRLAPQRGDEPGAAFRERIARTLHAQGKRTYAHEVLYNQRLCDDAFVEGALDRSLGDASITHVAHCSQAVLEANQRAQHQSTWHGKVRKFFS